MRRWQQAVVALLLLVPIGLAYLDWQSGPRGSRDPTADPNAFFASHQFLSAVVAEAFLIAIAYLLIEQLVEQSVNKRWAGAVGDPLASYLLLGWSYWVHAAAISRKLGAFANEDGTLHVATRDQLEAIGSATEVQRRNLKDLQDQLNESYRFLLPLLTGSPQLIPLMQIVESQQRRAASLARYFFGHIEDSQGWWESPEGPERVQQLLAEYAKNLLLLDQPIETALRDPRVLRVTRPRRLGQVVPRDPSSASGLRDPNVREREP